MAELKTQPTDASVADFIAASEPAGRREDAWVLLEMMQRITEVEPVMWGPTIVGFGSYHYVYASGHEGDMPVLGFSPRKASMSVYGLHYRGFTSLVDNIGPHKLGAGCLYLGRFTNLNLTELERAIRVAWNDGTPYYLNEALAHHE